MFCPYCGNLLEFVPEYSGTNVACPHCGGQFTMPGQPAMSAQPQVTRYAANTRSRKRQGDNVAGLLAAILSLFVPGLGQMCQGRIGIGMLFLVVVIVTTAIAFVTPQPLNLASLFVGLAVWLLAIVHAALS
jgi:TM2 domain-containing membrane protein YozV